jgi:phosphonate C-P lyase system protein PhnG
MLDAGPDTLAPGRGRTLDKALGGLKTALQQVIDAAAKEEVADLLDRLWNRNSLTVSVTPHLAMVMCTVADPFDCAFHLGEVLITQARVECGGLVGCGQILGDEPEKALLLAAVEAIAASGSGESLEPLVQVIERLARRKIAHQRHEGQLAAATVVNFESMKKERVDFGSLG